MKLFLKRFNLFDNQIKIILLPFLCEKSVFHFIRLDILEFSCNFVENFEYYHCIYGSINQD